MDRFLFRAWIKDEKIMIPNKEDCEYMLISDSRAKNPFAVVYDFDEYLNDEAYVLMQCTGLLDIKGNLIYEGDIVIDNERKTKAVVKFERGTFILCSDAYDDSYITFIDCEVIDDTVTDIEKIGNIYKNPDLINEDKSKDE